MSAHTAFEIAEWLAIQVAEATGAPVETVDHFAPFESLGVDSATIVSLSGELEDWLDQEVEPTLLFDYVCIRDLSVALEVTSPAL